MNHIRKLFKTSGYPRTDKGIRMWCVERACDISDYSIEDAKKMYDFITDDPNKIHSRPGFY